VIVAHFALIIALIAMMAGDEWIQKDECKGGFQSYTCSNLSGDQDYAGACDGVMTTTAALLSFAVLTLTPAAALAGLPLCMRSLNRYVGHLSFAFCFVGLLFLMSGWIHIADKADTCWDHIDGIRAASTGASCTGAIVIWVFYLPVLGIHYALGKHVAAQTGQTNSASCDDFLLKYFGVGRGSSARSSDSLLNSDRGSYKPPGSSLGDDHNSSSRTAIAMYDCEGDNDDELSFKKGDVLELLEREGTEWWIAKLHGKQGLVPANYLGDSEDI